MTKRLLSILVAVLMVFSLVPMSVFSQASDADDTYELTVSLEVPETVANPEVGDTLDVFFCISENSGLEAGQFAVEFNHDYLEVTGYNSTFSGSVYRLANTAYGEGASDKFGCTAPTGDAMNYQGQTGGNPFGEVGHWYANFLCGITTYEYDGVQVGGQLMRIRFKWTAIPSKPVNLEWNILVVEACVDADTGKLYTEGNVHVQNAVTAIDVPNNSHDVTFSIPEIPDQTVTVGNTFMMYFDISEKSSLYSGQVIIEYNPDYLECIEYGDETWEDGITGIYDLLVGDDEDPGTDRPGVAVNPAYPGNTGYVPVGETGHTYFNIGLSLTTFDGYNGVQLGGHLTYGKFKWKAVPAMQKMLQDEHGYYLPLTMTVIKCKYYVTAGSSAEYDSVTTIDGKVYVTNPEDIPEPTAVPTAVPTATPEPTAVPTATPEPTVAPTPIPATPDIYAICAYDFGYYDAADEQWVKFSAENPGSVTTLGWAPDAYAGAYAFGKVYGITTDGNMFIAPIDDLSNYVEIPTNLPDDMTVTSMTYDYTRNAMYGVALDDYYSYLVGIDITTGYIEVIGVLNCMAFCIAADENGVIYVLDYYDDIIKLNPDTLEEVSLGATDVDFNYVQDICYDFNTGKLYWCQVAEDGGSLYTIDKNTGAATYVGLIGHDGMELVSAFIVPAEEPEPASNIPVTGIVVTPAEIEIHVGDTFQLTAAVQPFNASNKNVEWDVDDEDIIAVDQDGVVLGLAEGTAMVFATTEDGTFTGYAVVNVLPPIGGFVKGYYFENDPEAEGWQFIDKDGDGYNWMWSYDYFEPYEGSGIIISASYDNDTYSPLNPDNWAISPAVTLPTGTATVTLYAAGQDPSYAAEVFGIYVGTSADPNSMVQVGADVTVNGVYTQYEFNLDQFTGKTVYIAIRHYHVTDMFFLNVDQVEIWGEDGGAQQHLWGDANGDGIVDTVDVLLVMRHVQGIIELDPEVLPWLDVNADGVVNFEDALLIARKVMDIISAFPVEL